MQLSRFGLAGLTLVTMVAFAGNSLLCRLALQDENNDAVSFTVVRLVAGASVLWLIVRLKRGKVIATGNWFSGFALFAYAAGFSVAYVSLPAASGALLLFAAVQATMIGHGIWKGEKFRGVQWVGLFTAFAGLLVLLLPGISTPPLIGSLLMLMAGFAWGVYSLRGRGADDPTRVTAGNFVYSLPFVAALKIFLWNSDWLNLQGLLCAVASGAVASGMGYALWYTVLPAMKATTASTVQLSVPVLASLGAVVLLSEPITFRLVLATAAILGGIAMVIGGSR